VEILQERNTIESSQKLNMRKRNLVDLGE